MKSDKFRRRVRSLNGLKTGRLCCFPKGGGCYEKIHIENFFPDIDYADSIYYKSKIAAPSVKM